MKTLVIAEPGCTAEGSLATFRQLIDVAASAGADVFKPQWTSSAERMCTRRRASTYRQFYQWLQFPIEWHETLKARCEAQGLEYACSVYLPEDVAAIAPFVRRIKVSSFEAADGELLRALQSVHGTFVISTGMMKGPEIRLLLARLRPIRHRVSLLVCTSAYPAPLEAMNLRSLKAPYVGLSDHSHEVDMGSLAVAAGARIVEAHLRLDDTDPVNPDAAAAFSPAEFEEYVRLIRRAERICGDGQKRLQPCERPMAAYRVVA